MYVAKKDGPLQLIAKWVAKKDGSRELIAMYVAKNGTVHFN